jgi:putative heme-binding domain-containing protein
VGCLKCHRVNGAGGDGGPELSHVAGNYGRAELIESVLFPSKKVADGFRSTTIALADGQVLSGLVTSDGDQRLVLIDGQGTKHEVRTSEIAARRQSDTSPMAEGRDQRLVLIDGQGTKHEVRTSEIAARRQSDTSPMPEGLQAGLTRENFADLIAYLETLR